MQIFDDDDKPKQSSQVSSQPKPRAGAGYDDGDDHDAKYAAHSGIAPMEMMLLEVVERCGTSTHEVNQ